MSFVQNPRVTCSVVDSGFIPRVTEIWAEETPEQSDYEREHLTVLQTGGFAAGR